MYRHLLLRVLTNLSTSKGVSGKEKKESESMEEIPDEDNPHSSKSSYSSPLIKRARKLLYRNLRVGVTDGRVFVGKFHCLDKQGNIILYDAVEYRQIAKPSSSSASASDCMEHRSLGLILISARVRTSCHVECSLDEQMSLLSLGDA